MANCTGQLLINTEGCPAIAPPSLRKEAAGPGLYPYAVPLPAEGNKLGGDVASIKHVKRTISSDSPGTKI